MYHKLLIITNFLSMMSYLRYWLSVFSECIFNTLRDFHIVSLRHTLCLNQLLSFRNNSAQGSASSSLVFRFWKYSSRWFQNLIFSTGTPALGYFMASLFNFVRSNFSNVGLRMQGTPSGDCWIKSKFSTKSIGHNNYGNLH